MEYTYNDGGRSAAGFRGQANDCVTRAIAIITGKSYREVYDAINALAVLERTGIRKRSRSNARTGVYKRTERKYLESLGYEWIPTMGIGTGCKVHLIESELPTGRLIVSVSRHLTAVIDHVIHDTFNPQRETVWHYPDGMVKISRRCVYGYYKLKYYCNKSDSDIHSV